MDQMHDVCINVWELGNKLRYRHIENRQCHKTASNKMRVQNEKSETN